jgi:hypothetical protein
MPPIKLAISSNTTGLEPDVACIFELSIETASVGTDTSEGAEVTGPGGMAIPRVESRICTRSGMLLIFVGISSIDDVRTGVGV